MVIYRRHQGNSEHPSDYPYHLWSDTLCYRALDEYQFGNKAEASNILKEALDHWDGLGFDDHSTKKDGFYANYKIGLFLYVADKMNYPLSPDTRADMERQMWRQQNPETGGITSLSDLKGQTYWVRECRNYCFKFTALYPKGIADISFWKDFIATYRASRAIFFEEIKIIE